MFSTEIEPFKVTIIPDTAPSQTAVKEAIMGFGTIFHVKVDDKFVLMCKEQILQEGEKFRQVTEESVRESVTMANYCNEIITYVKILIEDRINGQDFLDTLKELIRWAQSCKEKSESLKTGYTNIRNNLANILYDLLGREENVNYEKQTKDNEVKKEKKRKRTSLIATVGATATTVGIHATTVATLGTSSLITVPLGTVLLLAAATAEQKRRYHDENARTLEFEIEKLGEVEKSIIKITEQASKIITIVDKFQSFWQALVDQVDVEIGKFEHSKNQTDILYYNKLKGNAVIKQWENVKQEYCNYENNTRYWLNSTNTNHEISFDLL